MLLHRLRSSTHMHHYIRYMQTGDRLKHSSIQLSSRNIVDYRDAVFFDATTCHIRGVSSEVSVPLILSVLCNILIFLSDKDKGKYIKSLHLRKITLIEIIKGKRL